MRCRWRACGQRRWACRTACRRRRGERWGWAGGSIPARHQSAQRVAGRRDGAVAGGLLERRGRDRGGPGPDRHPAPRRHRRTGDRFPAHGRQQRPALHRRDRHGRTGDVRLRRRRLDRHLLPQRRAAAGAKRDVAAAERPVPQRGRLAVQRRDRAGRCRRHRLTAWA